jgi:hypothetical protein
MCSFFLYCDVIVFSWEVCLRVSETDDDGINNM